MIALTLAGLALWFPLSPLDDPNVSGSDTVETQEGHLIESRLHRAPSGDGKPQPFPVTSWSDEMQALLTVEVLGRPNETVTIHEADVRSPGISFAGTGEDSPKQLFLSPVKHRPPSEEVDWPAGQPLGYDETEFSFRMEPHGLTDRFPQVTVSLVVDGEQVSTTVAAWSTWRMPTGGSLAAAVASALPLTVAARILPSRWNAW